MDWSKGFSASYFASVVDSQTWRDIDRFEITSGSVKKTYSGLRVSADIETVNLDVSRELWVRVWAQIKQNDTSVREPVFTGLATAPKTDMDGKRIEKTLECYSVLKPAKDVNLDRGWYTPMGVSGAQIVKDLLSVSPAPIEVEDNSPQLSQYIIAEANENRLSMAEKILSAINWRLRIKGDGTIQVCSPASNYSQTFDALNNDCVEPQLKLADDWYSCPNVFRATVGEDSAVAIDDSADSILSTTVRGREVWAEENDCDLSDSESLQAYAERRLKELQRHAMSLSYDRRYFPDIMPTDLIQLHYPAQGIQGLFYVIGQTITLGHGMRTSEEVLKI